MNTVKIEKLTNKTFAHFGDVIDTRSRNYELINNERCRKFSGLSTVKVQNNDPIAFSIFESEGKQLPIHLDFVERHPLASQGFMPLHYKKFLITVAEEYNDEPVNLRAFMTDGMQGININPNVWHGVLCPVPERGRFLVVDRLETNNNLQIHKFEKPFIIDWQF